MYKLSYLFYLIIVLSLSYFPVKAQCDNLVAIPTSGFGNGSFSGGDNVGGYTGAGVKLAFDNNDNTYWQSNTSPAYAEIFVNLGSGSKVCNVYFLFEENSYPGSIQVKASSDWGTWTDLPDYGTSSAYATTGPELTVTSKSNYTSTNYSVLRIVIYGLPPGATNFKLKSCIINKPPVTTPPSGGGNSSVGWAAVANGNDIKNANTGVVYINGVPAVQRNDAKLKLSVNGSIFAEKLTVTNSWSDFVFKPGYKLLPLAEVEKFITANKHLPDVPGEKQIAESGVNVGETQSTLLRKIEELTLYLIEQNKKLLQQNKKLLQLKKLVVCQSNQLKKLQSKK